MAEIVQGLWPGVDGGISTYKLCAESGWREEKVDGVAVSHVEFAVKGPGKRVAVEILSDLGTLRRSFLVQA